MAAWVNRLLGRCKEEVFLESTLFRREPTKDGYYLVPKFQVSGGAATQVPEQTAWFMIQSRNVGDYVTGVQVTGIGVVNGFLAPHQPMPVASGVIGIPVQIAKQINMRRSILKESVDLVVFSYGTPDPTDVDNIRTSTDGHVLQTEFCYPRYMAQAEVIASNIYSPLQIPMYAQCFILAKKMSAQTTGGSGVFIQNQTTLQWSPVEWQEIGPERVWVTP